MSQQLNKLKKGGEFSQSPIYRLRKRNIRRRKENEMPSISSTQWHKLMFPKTRKTVERKPRDFVQADTKIEIDINDDLPMTVSRSPIMSSRIESTSGGDEVKVDVKVDVFACNIQNICLICQSNGEIVEKSQAVFCASCGLNLCPSCNGCSFCRAQWSD